VLLQGWDMELVTRRAGRTWQPRPYKGCHRLARVATQLAQLVAKSLGKDLSLPNDALEAWLELCVDLVITRAVRLHHADGTAFRALVPVFDLLNHGPPNIQHSLKGDAMEVITTRAVDQGEELVCNYGLTAEQWLVTHGSGDWL